MQKEYQFSSFEVLVEFIVANKVHCDYDTVNNYRTTQMARKALRENVYATLLRTEYQFCRVNRVRLAPADGAVFTMESANDRAPTVGQIIFHLL